MEKVSK